MQEENSKRHPVVLIHGFLCLREMMIPLQHRLQRSGLDVHIADLPEFNLGDVKALSDTLNESIHDILRKANATACDLVGVSLGGLIGLYFIKRLGGAGYVRRFVAMGTPFKGTWMSVAGVLALGMVSHGIWQALPDSPFLHELAEGPLPDGVDYYSIAVERDSISPPERSLLDGRRTLC